MRPVTFACVEAIPLAPAAIAAQMLDLALWPSFAGAFPLPGIVAAEFETRTPEVVGTRIRVRNTDGSTHVETIAEWDPERRLRLEFSEFGRPLSRLAAGFTETWEFAVEGDATRVTRSFELRPTTRLARLALRPIAFFLKRAVARHLRQMRAAAVTPR